MTITRRSWLGGALIGPALIRPSRAAEATLQLPLRTRVEPFKGSGIWEEVRFERTAAVRETALLLCDMWDNHWCTGAAKRVDVLAARMAPLVNLARSRGVQIIHSPSEVMDFYKDTPQRKRMQQVPPSNPAVALDLSDPPLPIDDSQGGCDTPDKFYKAWSRQHALIPIAEPDGISDNGTEVHNLLRQKKITNLLVMGVHTNMCVMKRTFAIRQMTKWGIRCMLIRDMTDSMYDPKTRPYVAHDRGTELVVEHIEKYWCPSLVSADLTRALTRASSAS
jgi:nicotinamidase-related amidase